MVQCRYFDREGIRFDGKTVVELGSGTGFVGLFVAKRGASRVFLTDIDAPKVLSVLEENVSANGFAAPAVTVTSLDWRSRDDCSKVDRPDVIVVCECIYNGRMHEDLISTIRALAEPHTVVYVCYAERHPEAESLFFERCDTVGFNVTCVPASVLDECKLSAEDGIGEAAAGVHLRILQCRASE